MVLITRWGFPGGSVIKNLPANAGDTGSIPDQGRSHMMWSKLNLCTTTIEPVLWSPGATAAEPACSVEPVLCNKRSHCSGTLGQSLPAAAREEPTWQGRPSSAKNKQIKLNKTTVSDFSCAFQSFVYLL